MRLIVLRVTCTYNQLSRFAHFSTLLSEPGGGALEVLHDRGGVAERVRPGVAAALRVPAAPLQAQALPARPLRLQAAAAARGAGGRPTAAHGTHLAHLPQAQPPSAGRPQQVISNESDLSRL